MTFYADHEIPPVGVPYYRKPSAFLEMQSEMIRIESHKYYTFRPTGNQRAWLFGFVRIPVWLYLMIGRLR